MIRFIVNPAARSGKGLSLFREFEQALRLAGISYETHLTEKPGHATELTASLVPIMEENDILGVVGGDGTMNEVAAGLPQDRRIRLFYLPAGSGNDFARGIGLEITGENGSEALLHPESHTLLPTDVGTVYAEGLRPVSFVVSSGLGYDAKVCFDINQSKLKKDMNQIRLGNLSYLLIGLRNMFTAPLTAAEITNEDTGEVIRTERLAFISAQNLPYEGGGFAFTPDARGDDGKLDFCVMTARNHFMLIVYLLSASFGAKHVRRKGVTIFRASSVRVKTAAPMHLHTDGETYETYSDVRFTAGPKSFLLLDPAR